LDRQVPSRDRNHLDAVHVRAPAKINLHLAVGPLGDDGYHELRTVFQAIDLFDEIRALPALELELGLTGADSPTLPLTGGNLAWQAAELLAAYTNREPAVRLELMKAIPIAAGLAGGSADAAAALVACDALWGTRLSREELLELAAELGSDVAFALTGGTALGTGRGERLSPILATGTYFWVLAVAAHELSTPAVYAELDRMRAAGEVEAPALPPEAATLDALRANDPVALGAALGNDLQVAAISLAPYLSNTLAVGLALGALGGIVSGSGPTCAFLVASPGAATHLAAELDAAGVCRTTRVASGPVHGARLVLP
jgi:4-diphosphocytidyl-2-C-methyl-D-erythritol kinase